MTFEAAGLVRLPRLLAAVAAGLFVLSWVVSVMSYFVRGNFDALWLLGIYTMPLGALSHSIVRWFPNRDVAVIADFVGLLIAGTIQYGVVGYLVGRLVGSVRTHSTDVS